MNENTSHLFTYGGKFASLQEIKVMTTVGLRSRSWVFFKVGLWGNSDYEGNPVKSLEYPDLRCVFQLTNGVKPDDVEALEDMAIAYLKMNGTMTTYPNLGFENTVQYPATYQTGEIDLPTCRYRVADLQHTTVFVRNEPGDQWLSLENVLSYQFIWIDGAAYDPDLRETYELLAIAPPQGDRFAFSTTANTLEGYRDECIAHGYSFLDNLFRNNSTEGRA